MKHLTLKELSKARAGDVIAGHGRVLRTVRSHRGTVITLENRTFYID